MSKLLKNINIQFISLVRKGANNKTVIFKSADNAAELHQIPIKKLDDVKQMVYGIVYSPDEVDAHGHQSNEAEIEAAAHRFMKSLSILNVDKQHTFKPEGAYVAENWIVRKGDPLFPDEKPGSWAVGIKIEDAALYKEAKETLPALSMAGTADILITKEDAPADEKTMFERFLNFIKGNNIQKEEKEMDEKKIQELIDASIKKAVDALPKAMTEEQMAVVVKKAIETAIPETLKPIEERIVKIEKSSPGTKQDEKDMSADDIKKCDEIGARIAKMAGAVKKEG